MPKMNTIKATAAIAVITNMILSASPVTFRCKPIQKRHRAHQINDPAANTKQGFAKGTNETGNCCRSNSIFNQDRHFRSDMPPKGPKAVRAKP